MADRRIINKPAQKTPVAGAENIMVKPKGMEERMKDVEAYLQQTDPILRTIVTDIAAIKNMVTSLNEEITKIAGVQSRTNSYLDGKLAEINATFGAIVSVVKKIDDDYHALFAEEGEEGQEQMEQGQEQMEEPQEEQPAEGEYSDEDLFEGEDEPVEEPKVIDVKPKVEKPVPKQPDKKKK